MGMEPRKQDGLSVDSSSSGNFIILFDGVCNLCNGLVRFIIPRDAAKTFRFAALQSDVGQELLRRVGEGERVLASVVLIEGHRAYVKSTAALQIARRLSGLWPLMYMFFIIPRPIRDGIYDYIASHRYRWFGQRDTCMVPTAETKGRFVQPEELL